MILVTDIIILNTKDNYLLPIGGPVSGNESKSDSLVGPPLSEYEGENDAGNRSPDLSDTPFTPTP